MVRHRRGLDGWRRDPVRGKAGSRGRIVASGDRGERKPGNARVKPARNRHADRA